MADPISNFYDSLQTVPKLIRDLAMGVAEAQRALDHDYLLNLAEFTKVIRTAIAPNAETPIPAADYIGLFKAMAPTRYQFTETTCEVHADLQLASSSEIKVGGEFGLKAAVFAVTVNASYTRKNAYNYEAAATIKTIIHGVSADPGVMEKLVARAASTPAVEGPKDERWKVIAGAFQDLFKQVPPPAAPTVNTIEPTSVKKESKDTDLTITGTGFGDNPKVFFKRGDTTVELTVKSDSATKITVVVKEAQLKEAGKAAISVQTESGTSKAVEFEITA